MKVGRVISRKPVFNAEICQYSVIPQAGDIAMLVAGWREEA